MVPRRNSRPVAGLGVVALSSVLAACSPGELGPQSSGEALAVESVLLITVDTLRHDALGFTGNPGASTPTLDRLAQRGVVFDRAYAHNVVTLPSHANILTGRLPHQHGVRDNDGFVLPDSLPTAASWLDERGFETAAFVAAFPLDRRFGLARGFDVYDDRYPRAVGERPATAVVPAAREWWRANSGRRRLLWLHLYDPHAPYEPPQETRDPYLGEVSEVDRALAPLLLPLLAEEESTLVLLTADHGEALGEHGEQTHGLFAYESVLRVPLILWAPGLRAARRADPAGHVDLLPTLLAAAGIEAPPGLAGRDLLAGTTAPPLYFEALTSTFELGAAPLRGALDGRYKWIDLPLPELYDVVADPAEARNLVDERRDVVRRLAATVPAESEWPPQRDSETASATETLRALGYLGGNAAPAGVFGPEDDPKNLVQIQRRMQEALEHLRGGRAERAEQLARQVLEERDGIGAAYHYLALSLLAQERLPEAIEVMEASRQAGLASPRIVRQLGLSLAEVGRFDEARELLEPLAGEGDSRALHDLAQILSASGDQAGAQRALHRLLRLDPEDPEAHQTLALVAIRRGEPREALAAAERAVELDPGLSLAWSHLGQAAYSLGLARQALEAWNRAATIDPTAYDALYNLTLVAEELGETELLRASLERFVATAPAQRYRPHLESARDRLARLAP